MKRKTKKSVAAAMMRSRQMKETVARVNMAVAVANERDSITEALDRLLEDIDKADDGSPNSIALQSIWALLVRLHRRISNLE